MLTSTQQGPAKPAALHRPDEPDDVQVALARQPPGGPGVPQEVVVHAGAVVELDGGDAGARQAVEGVELGAAVEEVPDVDHQPDIGRPGPAQQLDGDVSTSAQRRPGERLDGDQQPALGQPVGVSPRKAGAAAASIDVERGAATELAGAHVPATERVGDRLDPGESGATPSAAWSASERPAAEELDLDDVADPLSGEHGLHPADVQAGRRPCAARSSACSPMPVKPAAAAASQRSMNVFRGGSPKPAPDSVKKLATRSGRRSRAGSATVGRRPRS